MPLRTQPVPRLCGGQSCVRVCVWVEPFPSGSSVVESVDCSVCQQCILWHSVAETHVPHSGQSIPVCWQRRTHFSSSSKSCFDAAERMSFSTVVFAATNTRRHSLCHCCSTPPQHYHHSTTPLTMTHDDDELATRILERAQIAQMTRNLKLNLSRIPQVNNNSRSKSSSPAKKRILADKIDLENISPSKRQNISPLKNPLLKTTALNTSNDNIMNHNNNNTIHNIIPSTPRANSNGSADDSHKTPNNIEKLGTNSHQHDGGADLLIYLATSPYSHSNTNNNTTTNNTNKFNSSSISADKSKFKIPTTPLHTTLDTDSQPIRFSNLKTSLTSPQSTLKIPSSHNIHINQPHTNNNTTTPNLSFNDILLDSPALYLNNNTLSPQRRRSNIHINNTNSNNNDNSNSNNNNPNNTTNATPTTPSRELTSNNNDSNNANNLNNNNNTTPNIILPHRNNLTDNLIKSSLPNDKISIIDKDKEKIRGRPTNTTTTTTTTNNGTNNLLKTPNFNMGDYIHNLFSPSPRFNPTTNNLRRASINSLTTVTFLNNTLNTSTTSTTTTTTNNTNTNTNTISDTNIDTKSDKIETNNDNI